MRKDLINESTLLAWQDVDAKNWRDLVRDIASVFFESGAKQMKQLVTAWESGNFEGVRCAAHALKSSCANVGALKAHLILEQIESASTRNDSEKIKALMTEVLPLYSESCVQVSEFIKRHQAA